MSRGLGDRAHPAYFWLGAATVTVGVGLHLPMFVEAQRMNSVGDLAGQGHLGHSFGGSLR